MSGRPNAMGPILASLVLTWLSSVKPAVADEPVCLATERQLICTCDLTQLRPLQGAVGMKQIIYTEKRIADHPKHERRKLEEDPIKVVAGVGGQLFIIDHHHTAEAWLRAMTEWGAKGLCEIVNSEKGLPPEFKSEDEFWAALKAARLVRLKNEMGSTLGPRNYPERSKLWRTILCRFDSRRGLGSGIGAGTEQSQNPRISQDPLVLRPTETSPKHLLTI